MDIANLMWDETGRDYDGERRELSRTAALADAERLVGEFVYRADNDVDLINRLALAESQLTAVSSLRGYPLDKLNADLTKRWRLLATARRAAEQQKTAALKRTAAAEQAMDAMTARLAALAARENPMVPMAECLKLATEAVRKHADAYPLAYESWGGTGDGPFTDRAKHWQPPGMPKGNTGRAADPGANGGDSTFDEVHKRLDDLEGRVGAPAGSATASLDPVTAGMWQRLKDWWQDSDSSASSSSPVPEAAPAPPKPTTPPATTPAPAASVPEHVGPYDPTGWHGGAPARHAEDLADRAAERAHDEAGRREFDEIMRRLDSDQADMRHKFDNPGYNEHRPWRTQRADADRLEQANDAVADNMERRLNEAGAPAYSPKPIQHSLFD